MSQCNWNIGELRKLFVNKYGNKLLPRLEEYIESIYGKERRANYHAGKSKEIWEELFKANKVDFRSKKFQVGMESSTVEAEAMVQLLHSIGDVLAQVANLVIFGSTALPENNVTLNSVIKKMKNQNIALNVLQLLLSFKDSNEFQYITAFCNTIKHRKLLDIDYHFHVDCINKGVIEEGIRFKEFTYGGKNFPILWSHVICEEYRVKIYNLLCDVGIGMNEYLK